MQSMSDDDAAYSALLAQLLADPAPTRNARVHSWIEHQYDFVLSEHPHASSRPPSPSPSSSLGAHRPGPVDRPDSPLLPRLSSDRPSSPCPSYDALFFPSAHPKSDQHDFEEQERIRALRFIVQEMAHWKAHPPPSSHSLDKPLPAPPPSPASSVTHSISSRAMRSRSSSTRISRLPSFTSTLSSDQSTPQEIPPPLPISVIVHGECQHDLVLSRDLPLIDGCLHKRDDSFSHPVLLPHEQDAQLLCPIHDDIDSALQPSPTLSSFSYTHSRDSSCTTPCTSSPASPTSAFLSLSPCPPENITLLSPPMDDASFSQNKSSPSPSKDASFASPKTTVLPTIPDPQHPPHSLCAPKPIEYSQSRWSIATTASLIPSTAEPKPTAPLNPRTPPQEKKERNVKTPKKRARFISFISRLSPGRSDSTSTSTRCGDDVEYDSANDSDTEDKDKLKQRKSLSKKSSLPSLRASFSISRASFSSQRAPPTSPTEEVPPLPTSPTVASSFPDKVIPPEADRTLPRAPLSKMPSRGNVMHTPLPPIPQSASTITSFHSASRVSVSDAPAESPLSRSTAANASRVSLLPAPSKRTSLASAAGIEPMSITNSTPAKQTMVQSKSIFRLTAKPKSAKTPASQESISTTVPSKPSVPGNMSVPSSATVRSRISQTPGKFVPPAKLATVIATQSRQVPPLASSCPTSPSSMLPLRTPPRVPRNVVSLEETLPVEHLAPSSRLPMSAPAKGIRVGTVKGFWKRQ